MSLNIGSIKLGSNKKRYNHNLGCDNNTTADFGTVQPLYSLFMNGGDKLHLSMRQLVRLAPMPVPTFGRMSVVNRGVFVNIADVWPAYDCMLSGMTVSTSQMSYIPSNTPYINNKVLVLMCICAGSNICSCVSDNGSSFTASLQPISVVGSSNNDPVPVIEDIFGFEYLPKSSVHVNRYVSSSSVSNDVFSLLPTFKSFDFSFLKEASSGYILYLSRLNRRGKRLRKILIGLGYSLNAEDTDKVSLLPLMCYSKALFNLFSSKREISWSSTVSFKLFNYIYENDDVGVSRYFRYGSSYSEYVDLVFKFFDELLDWSFYLFEDDYFSVQRSTPNISNNFTSQVLKQPNGEYANTTSVNVSSGGVLVANNVISDIALQTLQRLQRYVNKDSIIGKKLSDWMRLHYGTDIADSLFKDPYNVGALLTECSVDDVFSTSDTASSDGTGEMLGAYAGKGLGFNNGVMDFRAQYPGYFFILSAVIPKVGYFQGNDPALYGIDKFTLPNPDFDALGMELTHFGEMFSDNGISDFTSGSGSDTSVLGNNITDIPNGFMPRYSGFKIKKNVVNGDMSLPSSLDDYSCYYLDNMLTSRFVREVSKADGSSYYQIVRNLIPRAGQVYRYVGKYDWLSNYNRIFYNSLSNLGDKNTFSFNGQTFDDIIVNTDNFLLQSRFDVSVNNQLRPISESFDTFDENNDNHVSSVSAE